MISLQATRSWPTLLVGALLTGFLALSVHVVMLEWLHAPYPRSYPTSGMPLFLTETMLTLATIRFWWLASPRLAAWPVVVRCAFLFLLLVMLREQLIRKPTMESMVTTAWTHSFVANISELVPFLVLACLVVPVTPLLVRSWQGIGGGFVLGLCAFVVAKRLFDGALSPCSPLSFVLSTARFAPMNRA